MHKDEEYDEGEHIKEVFAYFGRAFYMANVLEAGLALAVLQIEFLAKVKAKFIINKGQGFDRAKFEADFDAFLADQHAQTFGNLIRRVARAPEFDAALRARIVEAKEKRDFLGHHFFRERAVEFARRKGRDQMIEELQAAAEMFEAVNEGIDSALQLIWTSLGFPAGKIKKYVSEYIEEIKSTP